MNTVCHFVCKSHRHCWIFSGTLHSSNIPVAIREAHGRMPSCNLSMPHQGCDVYAWHPQWPWSRSLRHQSTPFFLFQGHFFHVEVYWCSATCPWTTLSTTAVSVLYIVFRHAIGLYWPGSLVFSDFAINTVRPVTIHWGISILWLLACSISCFYSL